MSICGLQGHAFTDPYSPLAPGTCDRCGWRWMHHDLRFQYQWEGNQLMNLRILVCPRCEDQPSEFLRPIVLPPDPVPILNPRPGFYAAEEGPPPTPESVQEILA